MMPVLSNHMHTTLKSLALVALTATTVNLQAADAVTVDAKIPAYAVPEPLPSTWIFTLGY